MPNPDLDQSTCSVNVTATGLVRKGAGFIYGVIVNSHSSGTLKLWNNTSAALDGGINPQSEGLVHDTFTFPTGSGVYTFPKPIPFNALYATVGGTLNCNLILDKKSS